jgi:hypothetical protein
MPAPTPPARDAVATPDRATVAVAVAGAAGVLLYVTAWAVAGTWIEGYDPVRDAISQTFAIGAPTAPRALMIVVLLVTGALLVAFGWALDRAMPGRGRAGPVAAAVSGVGTILAVVFPCSDGCPGFGTTTTDSLHVVVAGAGYVALILAPLFVARRVREHAPGLAAASAVLGGLALVGFVVRNLGIGDAYGGLLQRVFNTTADAWYLLAAWWIVARRGR